MRITESIKIEYIGEFNDEEQKVDNKINDLLKEGFKISVRDVYTRHGYTNTTIELLKYDYE